MRFAALVENTNNMRWTEEQFQELKWPGNRLREIEGTIDIALCHLVTHLEGPDDLLATHMIRDPRDVCVSGYFYHKWCTEPWAVQKEDGEEHSYQETINDLPKEEGLIFELINCTATVCRTLRDFQHYDDPRVLTFKYEEAMSGPKRMFLKAGTHLNFTHEDIDRLADIAWDKSIHKARQGAAKGRALDPHMRKGDPGDWENHFTDRVKECFKDEWGDLLIRLGYEKNNDW